MTFLLIGLSIFCVILLIAVLVIGKELHRLNDHSEDLKRSYFRQIPDTDIPKNNKLVEASGSPFIQSPDEIRSILIVKLDQIGDFIISMPVIAAIQGHFKNAKIIIATRPSNIEFAQTLCDDSHIISVENSISTHQVSTASSYIKRKMTPILKSINCPSLDLVIDLRYTGDSGKIAQKIKANYHIGFTSKWNPEIAERQLLIPSNWHDSRLRSDQAPHHVYRKFQYITELLTGQKWTSFNSSQLASMAKLVRPKNSTSKSGPKIVIHFQSNDDNRSIKHDQLSAIIEGILKSKARGLKDAEIELIGAQDSWELAESVRKINNDRIHNQCGKYTLTQLVSAIGTSNGVIAVNSAPMHIAALLKRPLVALFSLNELPAVWGPFESGVVLSSSFNYPCKPCRQSQCYFPNTPCLTDIGASDIITHLISQIKGK